MTESTNKQLLKNTSFLYIRTLLILVIGLYTSRVTMQALGVENYGIINVVGGFVAMFAILSGSLTAACQRNITYEIGKNESNLRQVFSASLYIHILLAIVVFLLAETVGLYIVNNQLNLPADKYADAQWVFQCSVLSFLLNLINIPYNAVIIAYERMKVFAYISLVEAFLKFLTVFLLLYMPYNKLVLYSLFTLLSATILRFIFLIYCKRVFGKNVSIEKVQDKALFKNIFSFAGWSFIGNTATILNNQGVNMMLNIFQGVTINAARGIASMIESTVVSFVNNFTTALNPQITKTYAQKDTRHLLELLLLGVRISYFLMIIMTIPIVIVTPHVLDIWLSVYPDYAVPFIRITLVIAVVQAMANPFLTAVLATGDIRKYQIIVGGLTLLNLPVSYLLLKIGLDPIYVYVSALAVYVVTFVIRLGFVRQKAHIPMREIIRLMIIRLIPIGVISSLISYLCAMWLPTEKLWGLVLFASISSVCTVFIIYAIGISSMERARIHEFILNKITR